MPDGATDLPDASSSARAWVRSEGGDQFVVFPVGFRVDAAQMIVRRDGGCVVLEPAPPAAAPETDAEWKTFWEEIDILRGDAPLAQPEREPPEATDDEA